MKTTLTLILALLAAPALAASDEDTGSVVSVQNREYRMNHELTVGAGFLPLDAFYKGVTARVGYTYHFNDHFGWQVGRASLSKNISTGLRKQLERDFGLLTTDYSEVEWVVGSDLVWTPLYGKTTFMNMALLYLELYVVAGGSGVKIQSGVQPAVDVGMGLRFFATERVSLRIEGSNHFVMGKKKFNVVDLNVGFAFNFGTLH
jgi:outer membrane beta-barrel protein